MAKTRGNQTRHRRGAMMDNENRLKRTQGHTSITKRIQGYITKRIQRQMTKNGTVS